MSATAGLAAFIVIGVIAFVAALLFAINSFDKDPEWW